MGSAIFPLVVLATSIGTWGFHVVLKRFAQGEVRERYLDRFAARVQFSKALSVGALLWLLTELF